MDKMLVYIRYLIGLFEDLYNNVVSSDLDSDYELINKNIFNYFNNNTTNLNEFNKDYYDCEEYKNIDKKNCLYNLMYAVYILMNEYENTDNQKYLEYLNSSSLKRNKMLRDIFSDFELCNDIIDTFVVYLDYSEARKKKIALSLMKNKRYINICKKNKYNYALFFNDISLNITEEAYLVDDVVEICNNIETLFDVSLFNNLHEAKNQIVSNVDDLEKVKKILSLKALINDINSNKNFYYIKHYFSIMLKNLYCDIYFSNMFKSRVISDIDNRFCELINKNLFSFDDLFLYFVNDSRFSAYLIGNFYFNNITKDMVDFESDDSLYEKYNLNEKLKKYYI